MQRAFPLPVNVGTDICQISRISDILTKHQSKYAHRFIRRVFTPQEQVWYRPRLLPLIEYLYFMERREFIQEKIENRQTWRAKSLEALIGLVPAKEIPLPNNTSANSEPVGSLIWAPYTTQGHPKILTKEEEASTLNQLKVNLQGVARFLAGRYAAKEAAKKAFSIRELGFHDITIDNPSLDKLRSRAPITLIKSATGGDDQIVPMSISHDGDYATAVCLSYESVTPPPIPDFQEIGPDMGRLLEEMTIKRLSLPVPSLPPKFTYRHTYQDSTLPERSQRILTPPQKIPVKLMTPITGRLAEIMKSTMGGSNIPTAETKGDLEVLEVSNPVQPKVSLSPTNNLASKSTLDASKDWNPIQPKVSLSPTNDPASKSILDASKDWNPIQPKVSLSPTNDPAIKSILDVSKVSSSVQPEASLPPHYSLRIRYHASASDPIDVDPVNPLLNRNYLTFKPRGDLFRDSQATDYPWDSPTIDNQSTSHPQDGEVVTQIYENDLIPQPSVWICNSKVCGVENSMEHRACVKCGTNHDEGWLNHIDLDSDYNIRLAQVANTPGLPFDIDPDKEELRKARVEVRQSRLKTRTESIYGLPTHLDPRVIKKNLENCLRVERLPIGITNEELIEGFKGYCTAIKGYVHVSSVGSVKAYIILSRKTEANKIRHLAQRPELLPVIRGHRLKMVKADDGVKAFLREYGTGARRWDWKADFWTTDVFHAYDKEECEAHAQRQEEVWKEIVAHEEKLKNKRTLEARVNADNREAKLKIKFDKSMKKSQQSMEGGKGTESLEGGKVTEPRVKEEGNTTEPRAKDEGKAAERKAKDERPQYRGGKRPKVQRGLGYENPT
ncbi:hypothetical protein SBOR_1914 [Sclerotinia borealis F-4128]|uniref:RanBP2-type domain-containing protein n=1 Tax=Sclerotinia borealis (strain F-4128) TaxID=1432307 RepID=W9CLQ6_SCLBF|nr:hypothetical protein SBOR_1914 [Sclerotinia borealis F-4128]